MATIAQIRQQYPQYNDMSDGQLADSLYKAHYSDMPRDQFNAKIGLSAPAQEPAPESHKSQALGFYQGIVKPFDNLALAVETVAKHAGVPVESINHALGLSTAAEAEQNHKAYVADKQKQGIEPGAIGKFAGEVVGTAPVLALTANPIVAGAAAGALTTDARDVGGIAEDTALGALGGKVGDVALKGAARVIAPKVRSAVQKLMAEGVELTPGQIKGGVAQRVEDSATSIPILGDSINAAKRRSLEGFNKAAVNRVLEPIGQKLPDAVAAGHDAVAHAQAAMDAAYTAVLPKLTVVADNKFASEMTNLRNLSSNLTPDAAKQVGGILDTIETSFSPGAKAMSGETMKTIDSELGRLARAYRSSAVGNERLVGQAISEAQNILRDTVERSNPAQAKVLKAINRGYANLVRVENAASKAKDGVFTPAQLQTATRVTDSSLRKKASARGTALMQDLATAGRQVLPSTVPDSGTAGRLITNALFGGGAAYLEPNALVGALGGAAAYTRPGVNALAAALTKRPQNAQAVANALSKLKGPASISGAALTAGPSN
jgi:hypothetical protein